MSIVAVFSVCGVPYLTMLPVVARDVLRIGASGYGLLLGCVGIGGLAGALTLAGAGAHFRRGRLLSVSNFVFPALVLAFALARSPWVAYPVLLGAGFAMIVNNALSNAILQGIVPDAMRGRLMAAYSLAVVGLSQVVGALLAGTVARAFGVAWAIGGGAAIMIAFGAWVHRRYPELRRL
jgi:MFS family permease